MKYLKSPIFKVGAKYGLFSGVMSIFILWVFVWLGQNPLYEMNFLVLEVILLGIFVLFAIKEFKDRHGMGELRFWQGMSTGFVVYLTTAIVFTPGLWLFLTIEPQVVAEYIQMSYQYQVDNEEMQVERMGRELYEKGLKELKSVRNQDLLLSGFLKKLFLGMFITPLISLILRK